MSWEAAASADGARDFIRGVVAHAALEPRLNYELGVEELAGGLLVGNCRLSIDRGSAASIGYVYRRDRWGRGYGTEVLTALIRFGFDDLGLHRLHASAHVDNRASWRVMEKAGMRREGRLRDALRMSGGWADTYLYSILEVDPRPDFR